MTHRYCLNNLSEDKQILINLNTDDATATAAAETTYTFPICIDKPS